MSKSKKDKLKKTCVNKKKSQIKPTNIKNEKLIFSFTHLKKNCDKFSFTGKNSSYFIAVIERLKDLSEMTRNELTIQNKKQLRCHRIDWDDPHVTEKCFGLENEEQLVDIPYQLFQISSNQHGRVHGFFIDNICFIVWLDPDHKLYP